MVCRSMALAIILHAKNEVHGHVHRFSLGSDICTFWGTEVKSGDEENELLGKHQIKTKDLFLLELK